MSKVEIIKNCPSCSSSLERVKGQLFCRNKKCETKSYKKILHFAQEMKIKGLGEKTIEKLNLESISDIYDIPEQYIIDTLGSKLGVKLIAEIAKSKKQSLDVLLASFGINLIGTVASRKIAPYIDSISDISPVICRKAGLGEKATISLCNWVVDNKMLLNSLPITFERYDNTTALKDMTVCITGKIDGFTRSEAEDLLVRNGIKCVSAVSSKVNYLICNDENSSSSKATAARKLNIEIMSFENFLKKENINE